MPPRRERGVVEVIGSGRPCDPYPEQVISTLKAVGVKVGLLINFDEARLVDGLRRVILSAS